MPKKVNMLDSKIMRENKITVYDVYRNSLQNLHSNSFFHNISMLFTFFSHTIKKIASSPK